MYNPKKITTFAPRNEDNNIIALYMNFGTPLTSVATKALLLGSGELGKEVALELQRYGVEVVACDKYANAPAMQVAHRCHVFNMLDGATLRQVIETEQPSMIIPEVHIIFPLCTSAFYFMMHLKEIVIIITLCP